MVLLIDDDLAIVELIEEVLAPLHRKIIKLTDPVEALNLIKLNKFNCIITDIGMPHINGIELIASIRELDPDVKIICVSGFGELLKHDLQNLNVDVILNKPFKVSELVKEVKKTKSFKHVA